TSVTPIDDRAFIPRDPVMSIMQSALEEYFETQEPAAIESLLQGRRSSKTSAVTDRRLKNVTPIAAPPPGRRLFNKFSILDAHWVACKVAEGITKWRGPHSFNTTPATPV